MISVRDEFLLFGRGAKWVRYEAELAPLEDEAGNPLNERGEPLDPDAEDEQGERIAGEAIHYDFVTRRDFGHSVARTWREVNTVWRKVYMTRDELIERFGEEKGKLVSLDHKRDEDTATATGEDTEAKATIYEIWDKPSHKVISSPRWATRCLRKPSLISA